MSRHALDVLEFERVLERVARRASSDPGRRRVLALRPMREAADVARELGRVSATVRFVSQEPTWALGPVPDVTADLSQLGVDGAVLEPLGLHRIGVMLRSSRLLRAELAGREGGSPELRSIGDRLLAERELEKEISSAIDEEGAVLSSASRELKRVRDRLRGAHSKIVRQLESYLATLPERYVVPDASVTIREGRYVIPLRREGKGEVGGIVHDESQTGATLFVEPPAAIELMNRLRDLEREEAREIRRVLGELTAAVAPRRHDLEGALAALADFDALLARARSAISWGAAAPEIDPGSGAGLVIREGRHPLLVEAGAGVVPFDLVLAEGERCLVVSGPNTGGKSVLLKAVGLVASLAQSGVVPPVGQGTRLPVFTGFFADIGDEQSIARSLSTFSAHLANLSDLVEAADANSLVLIDEMGTGTDPAEGAALARAVIEELVRRGATTLVSSHLGDLKRLDTEGSGIVNASLQFDPERMEPTYRLVKGRPGRSYGLAIARRLGFPSGVLDRAEALRSADAASVEDVLARLEAQERRAGELASELQAARTEADARSRDVEARASALEEAERTAGERARQDARSLLMEARSEVEEAIRELRSSAKRGEPLDEAAHRARGRVEEAARRQRGDVTLRPSPGEVVLGAGDHVRVHATGARGRVVEVRAGRAVVEVGALRMELPTHELRPVDAPVEATARARTGGGWSAPEGGGAKTEVDLRGKRVDEVEVELQRALDQAVIEELSRLLIIHGKGTGALRKRVAEILETDRRVTGFRMGGAGEGGAGVTVATLGESG